MNRTDLFAAVARYFDLMEEGDKARVIDVFSADATVVDDGHSYVGRAQVLGWLTGPASEFTTTSTWLSVAQDDRASVVTIRLAGDFPGSPVDLRYEFAVGESGLIDSLAITA